MNLEEAQQAETIAEIRAMNYYPKSPAGRLLEIVDSQAQKIEAMQKQLNAYSLLTEAAGSLIQKQYTEDELREAYEMHFETAYDSPSVWQGFKDCAHFLGAIKEKEE